MKTEEEKRKSMEELDEAQLAQVTGGIKTTHLSK